jgi:hypothetical protein
LRMPRLGDLGVKPTGTVIKLLWNGVPWLPMLVMELEGPGVWSTGFEEVGSGTESERMEDMEDVARGVLGSSGVSERCATDDKACGAIVSLRARAAVWMTPK